MPTTRNGDPLLKGKAWENVKAYWRAQRTPTCQNPRCKNPRQPVDYDHPGTPWSLDVGHMVDRAQAKAMGWTKAQINALTNTRPEHATCNRSSGAAQGNQTRATTRTRLRARPRARAGITRPTEASEW